MTQSTTEARNPRTTHIDQLTGPEIAALINQEDAKVAQAVATQTAVIGQAIEAAAVRFKQGGRLIYIGAGTSGRLGALDAIELTPTYSVSPQRAFGLLAGGKQAMFAAVEGAEDSPQQALKDLQEVALTAHDTLIAISASGNTPYALGALKYGNQVGALTLSVTCNPDNQMEQLAQIAINPIVGPEVITGSTRMKAGTAQKMVLNILSTGIMIKLGYVYQNLMINVQPTNQKLIRRSQKILMEVLDLPEKAAQKLLEQADFNVATAIVMERKQIPAAAAQRLLQENDNRVFETLSQKD